MTPKNAQPLPRCKILQYNPTTHEPFIRLRAPFEHIILTPLRQEDASDLIKYLNDPQVFNGLTLPVPYLSEHATGWIKHVRDTYDELLEQVSAAEADDSAMVNGIPLSSIRELKADGTEELIGQFDILRCTWSDVKDEKKRKELQDAELSKQVGDPDICWQMGGMDTWILRILNLEY
jgi:RimJ/RimL family protein N-acetyltransferase